MSNIEVKVEPSGVAFSVPWNQGWLDEFKQLVPYKDRNWDKPMRRWWVAFPHAAAVAQITEKYFGQKIELPDLTDITAVTEEYAIRLLYITVCKKRDDGSTTAFGFYNGGWNVVFPEEVLKGFFDGTNTDTATLYSVLLLPRAATAQEIKSAYRRLARQWHPDVCPEDTARERFQEIDTAYKTLCDPLKKKRYDAGLVFEESLRTPADESYHRFLANPKLGYRPPLRCGDLTVEASRQLGKLHVSKITKWDDITDARGRVLVTSWDSRLEQINQVWTENYL